jgi:hypothetical protein
MALVLLSAVPVAAGIAAWTVAGIGIGLAYAPISLLMLAQTPPGREGWASASLDLMDTLGKAIGIGIGGAAVAGAIRTSRPVETGVAIAFAMAAAPAAAGLAVIRALPARPPGAGPAGQ